MFKTIDELSLAVIGLGYVGLPLAVEFAKQREVRAFDIDETRLRELRAGFDRTLEISSAEFKAANNLLLADNIEDLKCCNCYIITR